MSLVAHDVGWTAGGQLILDGVSVTVPAHGTLGLIGPNGSGKSSLLRLLAGLGTPDTGTVTLANRPLRDWRRRDLARKVALVEQHAGTEVDITVQDIVRLGRTPHRGALSPWNLEDDRIVAQALAQTGLGERASRYWRTLSGGERQRVQIARALAQCPSELLLDEPTNHLDIQHQLDVLKLIRGLPLTCVMAIHDLNLAALFCDSLLVLQAGRVVARGTPAEVITPAMIDQVYGVRAQVQLSPHTGRPHVQYLL
ncbi:MAG: ABC transporter ATP-binding protein [Pseudomonas sp.]|nr:ABC transporter ATP-binding protein [Pseudomonas sp.]